MDVEPNNEWFASGGADRIIKIWDLAKGTLRLSLTGHISAVRAVKVSNRHPFLFSGGEDKQVFLSLQREILMIFKSSGEMLGLGVQ